MAVERYEVVSRVRPVLVLLLGLGVAPMLFFVVLGKAYSQFFATMVGNGAAMTAFTMFVPCALFFVLGKVGPLRGPYRRHMGVHEIIVGRDGVQLSELDDRRFVPFAEIASVTIDGIAVVLGLASGERLPLHVWTGATDADASRRRGVINAIEEGRAVCIRSAEYDDVATRLARNGRPLDAWVGFARELGRSAGGYREATTSRDDLWRIVEDGGAAEDARIAAALALRVEADGIDQVRLASIAADSASPRVRISITVPAEDDATLASALQARSA